MCGLLNSEFIRWPFDRSSICSTQLYIRQIAERMNWRSNRVQLQICFLLSIIIRYIIRSLWDIMLIDVCPHPWLFEHRCEFSVSLWSNLRRLPPGWDIFRVTVCTSIKDLRTKPLSKSQQGTRFGKWESNHIKYSDSGSSSFRISFKSISDISHRQKFHFLVVIKDDTVSFGTSLE